MPYYTPSGKPTTLSRNLSEDVRDEFTLIQQGFGLLPDAKLVPNYAVDIGAADAYLVTLSPVPASYTDGMAITFKASASNTGASTINVNSLGVKSIVRRDGSALSAADIVIGKNTTIFYNSISGKFEISQLVAGDMAKITTVSGIASAVSTVAGISANVTTVAGLSAEVTAVAGISGDVSVVSGIASDVTTVAGDTTNIGTVAGISSDVTTVSGIAADVATVAGIASDVTAVAGDLTNVDTVAGNIADVAAVGAIDSDVSAVAGIDTDVTTVAGITSDVTTVAGVALDVTMVAGISTAVSTVATNVAAVGTCATNIAAIIDAPNQASSAAASAAAAANQAAALVATSASSVAIGTGSKTFTTQSGKQFAAGQWIQVLDQASSANYMLGRVTSYSSTSLVVNVTASGGSGTISAWNIYLSGIQGPEGPAGTSSLVYSGRTSNTKITAADKGKWIAATSGSWTQTFDKCADLGSGFWCYIANEGSVDTDEITLDPDGSETIDGLTSYVMYRREARLIQCDGLVLRSKVINAFAMKRTVTYTHVEPPGYIGTLFDGIGGAAGGGSGRRGAASSLRGGGGPGGAPGRVQIILPPDTPGTTTTVTIGAGGAGGAAVTTNDTDGNPGTAGGNTSFGTKAIAYGGRAGAGGDSSGGGHVAGSGAGSAASAGNPSGGAPSAFLPGFNGLSIGICSGFGTGGADIVPADSVGASAEWGGASSSRPDMSGITQRVSGSSLRGVGAASCGGWITAADTMPTTAPRAGKTGTCTAGGGAIGGTCGATPTVGADGAASDGSLLNVGNPGAGGGSSTSAAGQAGGAGSAPGGPGGGGGASLNGYSSGPGGAGADGRATLMGII